MASAAWDDISELTIARSWCKYMQRGDCTTASTDHMEEQISDQSDSEMLLHQLNSNLQDEDIRNWVNGMQTTRAISFCLMKKSFRKSLFSSPMTQRHIMKNKDSKIPNSGEVTEMLEKCLLWYEQEEESKASSLLLLKRLRGLAATK